MQLLQRVVAEVGEDRFDGDLLAMEHALSDAGAFEEFFIRWRLEGMPAPFVPQPMGVHLPVVDLRPVLGHMRQGGTTFYIPDICPIPSRDKLREILEEALRDRNAPDYLAEWFEIVHSDNVAKNQIPRYARIFEVQHYLRALYARHAVALERKKSAIVLAISEDLKVSDDSIERDLSFIADRLGSEWYLPLFNAPEWPHARTETTDSDRGTREDSAPGEKGDLHG